MIVWLLDYASMVEGRWLVFFFDNFGPNVDTQWLSIEVMLNSHNVL